MIYRRGARRQGAGHSLCAKKDGDRRRDARSRINTILVNVCTLPVETAIPFVRLGLVRRHSNDGFLKYLSG